MIGSVEPRAMGGKVYVVDDDEKLRDATCLCLSVAGYDATGYSSGRSFLDAIDPHAGGCGVFDVNMPDISGIELQRQLNNMGSNIAVIFVTGYGNVPMAVSAVRAGAIDFIEKPYRPEVLLAAIDRAFAAEPVVHPQPAKEAAEAAISALTVREGQVLKKLAEGLTNREIATVLGLSPRTVEMHRANMMQRLGVFSLPEALRIAYDAGFLLDRRRSAGLPRPGGRRASDRKDGSNSDSDPSQDRSA
jgi:two-component system response regulator FixJ